jgi:NitT/TauT family transport system ATP-binding protein
MGSRIVSLSGVRKSFASAERQDLLVLDRLDFHIDEGEIVVLLGKSGSGKSTLLRIIAGLVAATEGEALYRGERIEGTPAGVSMVFQNFALFPWLTVLENVELGLLAARVPRDERRGRALAAIDSVGLDGFETAFPRELSGGMRQRVGFARALVVDPDLLLMDEPFSALDILTAESLRADLLELWHTGKIPTKGILIVSHSMEEAVLLADRVLIFDSNPGRIKAELRVSFPYPRDNHDPRVRALIDQVYALMSRPARDSLPATPETAAHQQLPPVSIGSVTGLLEDLIGPPHHGRSTMAGLADSSRVSLDEIAPLAEAATLLQFATIDDVDVAITYVGRSFVEAGILREKQIFAQQLQRHVPLAAHIRRILDERRSHRAPIGRFRNELEDSLAPATAAQVLRTVIDWGRFAELFAYDSESGVLFIEDHGNAPSPDAA